MKQYRIPRKIKKKIKRNWLKTNGIGKTKYLRLKCTKKRRYNETNFLFWPNNEINYKKHE